MVGAEVRSGERKLMDLQTVFSRFATQYSFEIFDLTDGRPLPVYGDCAVLYRALSLCAQELLTMPSNGKYDSKPHVRLTADETTVCLSLIRCRVRPDDDDTGVRMVDAAVTKAGGEVRTVCHTDGESRYGYEIKYLRTVLPEKDNCMTDEFDKYLKDNAFVHDYLSFLCAM